MLERAENGKAVFFLFSSLSWPSHKANSLCNCCSVAQSCLTLSNPMDCSMPVLRDSLPCPSLSPAVCSDSCPLSRWCHPTISSCCPLLLLPSIFASIRVFSSDSTLRVRHLKPQEKTIFMVRGPERRGPGQSDSVREVQRGVSLRRSSESVGICTSPLLIQSYECTEQTQRRREGLGRLNWGRKYYPPKAKRNFPSQYKQVTCTAQNQHSQRT